MFSPPLLSNLSLFFPSNESISAFYLDIEIFFHNLILPGHISDLFPLPPIYFHSLSTKLHTFVTKLLNLDPSVKISLRPRQVAIPIFFTCSFVLAHHVFHASIQQSFNMLGTSSFQFNFHRQLQALNAPYAPFSISPDFPLIFHVIYYIEVIMGYGGTSFCKWFYKPLVFQSVAKLIQHSNNFKPNSLPSLISTFHFNPLSSLHIIKY